jgi:hypothetical protein
VGRLKQIKDKWDKKKNKVFTKEEIKNRVADKQQKYENNTRRRN